jgi:lipid II isoglutaminyl synthase (glutamine-hydrolysing)
MSAAALAVKVALARTVGALSRLRGGGTSAPGRLLIGLQRDAIAALGARLAHGSVLVSATNGKTTTARMAARIFSQDGTTLVHNEAGANMAGGVATALLGASRRGGQSDGELGLFEVDELWLDRVAAELKPRAIVLGNLFRDQLDRYGELEAIAQRWAGDLHTDKLVLNADDPLVADLGRNHPGHVYFGVEDDSLALAGMEHASDARHCRRCGAPYRFDVVYLGHLGHYHCPQCGQQRPSPAVTAREVELEGVHASRFTLVTAGGEERISLALPGLYNVYNALAAAALATAMDVPLAQIASGLAGVRAAFGRAETVTLTRSAPGAPAREMRILLVKNPAGANEVLRTLVLEPGEHDLLGVLNDEIADGRDVSWIWDADFELLSDRVRHFTCAGTRAADLAVRLKYAGLGEKRVSIEPDISSALAAAARDGAGERAPLYALPTYTAMLELRKLLVARGEARGSWS